MNREEDRRFFIYLLPLTLLMLLGSFLQRWYWPELHELRLSWWDNSTLGAYPSDVWYMHYNYGWFFVHYRFFRIEYQAPMFMFCKVLAVICQHLCPATEPQEHGGFIFSFHAWLVANTIALTPFAIALVWCMHRLDVEFFKLGKNRLIWGFVLTPTFMYFSIFNYDLIPMACCVAGLLYLLRGEFENTFMLLGIGASFKTYPGVLLLPYILYRPTRERWIEMLAWFTVPVLMLNLPFMIGPFGDFHTWLFPYEWQGTYDLQAQPGRPLYHLGLLIGRWPIRLALLGVMGWYVQRWRQREDCDQPLQLARVSLFLTTAFIMLKGVFSPQYIFWMLPFLTLTTAFPWWGLGTVMEIMNIAEAGRLDHWRFELPHAAGETAVQPHMWGLILIRLLRDIWLIGLMITWFVQWTRQARQVPFGDDVVVHGIED